MEHGASTAFIYDLNMAQLLAANTFKHGVSSDSTYDLNMASALSLCMV